MTGPEIPIDQLNAEELLVLRQRIDQRLDAVRNTLVDQAQRLGLVVTNGAKRKPRATKTQDHD